MNNCSNSTSDSNHGLVLTGLDGTNPLGFLAALGVLSALTLAHRTAKVALSWEQSNCIWLPRIHGLGNNNNVVGSSIASYFRLPFHPLPENDRERTETQSAVDQKKKELKKATDAVKSRSLRGNELKTAQENELGPIRFELDKLRKQWLVALRASVASPELSLGKHLNATCLEFRDSAASELEDATSSKRMVLDYFAAFGSDVCRLRDSEVMVPTPFCFITGSGHQYFLDTVRQLMEQLDDERINAALFTSSEPLDEKLSMRWDPQEDRRYAVMWSDPGKSDKPKTNWARNFLGYLGLQLYTSVPVSSSLCTTGWQKDRETFRWPIWCGLLSFDLVRSLLSHPSLGRVDHLDTGNVSQMGVASVYECNRLEVGTPPLNKVNFSPSRKIA